MEFGSYFDEKVYDVIIGGIAIWRYSNRVGMDFVTRKAKVSPKIDCDVMVSS